MIVVLASSLVDWSALGKILLAALIGGAGVVIVFALLLIAVDRATSGRGQTTRIVSYALGGVCSVLIVSAVVAGIYAMAHKPKSKPAPKPGKSALIVPESPPPRVISFTV